MWRLLFLSAGVWVAALFGASAQVRMTPAQMRMHPAIAYDGPTHDPVARLNERLQRGEVLLESEPVRGYLRAMLRALDVPESSQVLVFSKTSFQAPRIGPSNPRAIFFNDSVAVGWVRGGDVLEFTAQDPRQGTIFYTLDQSAAGVPQFRRNNVNCVLCHTSDTTMNVPGPFIGSVFPERSGMTGVRTRLYDGSSQSLRSPLGRLVRDRAARRDEAHGQCRGPGSERSGGDGDAGDGTASPT